MKPTVAVLALLLSFTPAMGQERAQRTTYSKGSPLLRLVERSDSYEKGSFASWKGKLELTGKLVLEFDRAPAEEPEHENSGAAFFEPDPKSRRLLPEARGYYALPVAQIDLGKSAFDVLAPLLGRSRALEIALSKVPRYELPVVVSLTAFSTSVECDHRMYSMEYASIRLLRVEVIAVAEGKGLGC